MKTIIKILLIGLFMGYLVFAVTKLHSPAEERVCSALNISIDNNSTYDFVDSDYVQSVLKKEKYLKVNTKEFHCMDPKMDLYLYNFLKHCF